MEMENTFLSIGWRMPGKYIPYDRMKNGTGEYTIFLLSFNFNRVRYLPFPWSVVGYSFLSSVVLHEFQFAYLFFYHFVYIFNFTCASNVTSFLRQSPPSLLIHLQYKTKWIHTGTNGQNAEGWWKSVNGHTFQNFNNHIKILGARWMTWSNFHTDDPKILGAISQKLVATVTWRPKLAYPWSKFSYTVGFGPHRSVAASKSGPTISSSFFQYYYFLVTPV
jgi:hypothetical protein